MGGLYIVRCLDVIAAPGVPLAFAYKSPGGNLNLRVGSFAYDWRQGLLTANQLSVTGPEGLIAGVDYLRAENLLLTRKQDDPIRVHVQKTTVNLRRNRTGDLELQSYFPKGPKQKNNLPFAVNVNQAAVSWIDRTGPKPWVQNADVRNIRVDGLGDGWLAVGRATLTGIGIVDVSAQNLPDQGILVNGSSTGLQLASSLHSLAQTREGRTVKELRDISATSLRIQGPFTLFIPTKPGFEFATKINGAAENLRYQDYSFDRTTFVGSVGKDGLQGQATIEMPGIKGNFDGSAIWTDGLEFGGEVVASLTSEQAIPSRFRKSLPKGIHATAPKFSGWLGFKDEKVTADGSLSVARLTGYGQSMTDLRLRVHAEPTQVRVLTQNAVWEGANLQGAADIFLNTKAIRGQVVGNRLDLRRLARRFGGPSVNAVGTGNIVALLGGTLDKPTVDVRAKGNAIIAGRDAGNFDVAANFSNNSVSLLRGALNGPAGSAAISGTWNRSKDLLNLQVDATNLDLSRVDSELQGNGRFSGTIGGPIRDPRLTGQAEAYSVQYQGQTIPLVTAGVSVNLRGLQAFDVNAFKGTGQVTGDLAWQFKNGALSGTASGTSIQLNGLVASGVDGVVDVPSISIGGTFKNPVANAHVTGEDLFVQKNKIDTLEADVSLVGSTLSLTGLTATALDGSMTGTGTYDLRTKKGSASATAKGVSLGAALAQIEDLPPITGSVNLTANASFDKNGLVEAKSTGTLDDVKVRGTSLGSGFLNVHTDGRIVSANSQVGLLGNGSEPDRYVQINDARIDLKAQTGEGSIVVLNNPLGDLYQTAAPYLNTGSTRIDDLLRGASGLLSADVDFSGDLHKVDLNVRSIDATELVMGGRSFGDLTASVQKIGNVWDNINVKWTGGEPISTAPVADPEQASNLLFAWWSGATGVLPKEAPLPKGSLQAQGRIDEKGEVDLNGELRNFDVSLLGVFEEELARLRGTIDIPFLAEGPTRSPLITASINTSPKSGISLDQEGVKRNDQDFTFQIGPITVSESKLLADGSYSGGVKASGNFFYKGLQGLLSAQLPLDYPLNVPKDGKLTASVELASNALADFKPFISGVDWDKTEGSVKGSFAIGGPLDNLTANGGVTLTASKFKPSSTNASFHDVITSLTLEDNNAIFSLRAAADQGGSISSDATSQLPPLRRMLDLFAQGDSSTITSSPVKGVFDMTALMLSEKTPGEGLVKGIAGGHVDIAGVLRRPSLTGTLTLSTGEISLPTKELTPGEATTFPINPRFDLRLQIPDSVVVKNPAATIDLVGDGTLTGTLSRPEFTALLNVQNGTFRLPTARVTLDPQGTVRPYYSVGEDGTSLARLDVNLRGRTGLTAVGPSGLAERYDITLDISGDLLGQSGLTLNAQSDPPGLDEQRIIALIGQVDALQGIDSIGSSSSAQRNVQEALTGVALPALLNPFTSKIGAGLGLDYLNVEYDRLDQASVVFAKSINKYLTIQGRRQISEPLDRQAQRYDIRLVFRPPFRNSALRNLSFSFGADQDRPWKIAIEYSFRF